MRAARLLLGLAAASLLLSALLPQAGAAGAASILPSGTQLPLADVAFRHDGAVALAVGGLQGQGVVLRVVGTEVRVAREDPARWLAVAWSPTAPEALLAGDGGVLRTSDGLAFHPLALPAGLASFQGRAVAWRHDGSQALVAGSALLRYHAANQSLELLRASADEAYGAAAWKPDGSSALVEQARREGAGWATGRLLRYDASGLAHVATYGPGNALVEGITWAGSGAWALVHGFEPGSGQGPVRKWDGATLTTLFTKAQDRFTSMAWRPGGTKALLTGSTGQRLAETDGATYQVLQDAGGDLLAAAWHPAGERALLVGPAGMLQEWLPEGRPTVALAAPLSGATTSGVLEVLARAEPRPGHALTGVEVRVGEGPWQALQAPLVGERHWRGTLDTATLGDGLHLLEARARDAQVASEVARVNLRVRNQPPQAPALTEPPVRDADGVVPLAWTGTGADRYEVQAARDAAFGSPATTWSREASTALVLDEAGAHHVRVRGWHGAEPSPWSAPAVVEVTLTESPFRSAPPQGQGRAIEDRAAPGEGTQATPGLELGLALTAALAAGLARRQRAR